MSKKKRRSISIRIKNEVGFVFPSSLRSRRWKWVQKKFIELNWIFRIRNVIEFLKMFLNVDIAVISSKYLPFVIWKLLPETLLYILLFLAIWHLCFYSIDFYGLSCHKIQFQARTWTRRLPRVWDNISWALELLNLSSESY